MLSSASTAATAALFTLSFIAAAATPDATVVEYYAHALDHYFMTSSTAEMASLDSGALAGWSRTGQSFRAYASLATAPSGANPVCRFYGLPSAQLDSHFYSAFPAECNAVTQRFAGSWELESSSVFAIQVPDTSTGACPAGTSTVYRLWNGRVDSNHRYTTSASVRAQMIAAGWMPEEAGTDGVAMCAAADGIDPQRIPLGDGKVSTAPRAGYVWSCQSTFNGGGAAVTGPWLRTDSTWDSTTKIAVGGVVTWPSAFSALVNGSTLAIAGNGLPYHATGTFPIATSDPAYAYDRNPNRIAAQNVAFSLPASPALAATSSCLPLGSIGTLITGAAFFNALDAQGRDAVAHELQDSCQGHPEVSGTYHYHSVTSCVHASDTAGQHSPLVGYAKDGFGLYGNLGEDGKVLTNADLDECHGHGHAIVWNGALTTLYHYHATREYIPIPWAVIAGTRCPDRVRSADPVPITRSPIVVATRCSSERCALH